MQLAKIWLAPVSLAFQLCMWGKPLSGTCSLVPSRPYATMKSGFYCQHIDWDMLRSVHRAWDYNLYQESSYLRKLLTSMTMPVWMLLQMAFGGDIMRGCMYMWESLILMLQHTILRQYLPAIKHMRGWRKGHMSREFGKSSMPLLHLSSFLPQGGWLMKPVAFSRGLPPAWLQNGTKLTVVL